MNPIKKLVSHTAIYGFSSIVGRLLNYLLVPLYTRIFLPEEYGVVTELYAYVVFLIVILTYGMETAYFRFSQDKSKQQETYSTILISVFSTSLVFAVLTILFSGNIASELGYSGNDEYIRWFAIIIAVDAFVSIPFARLRNENKAVKFASIKFINIILNIGLNVFFLVLLPKISTNNPQSILSAIYNPEIGVGYIFISNLVASLLTFLLLSKEIFVLKIKFDKALYRKLLNYALPLLIVGLAGSINEVIDRILLKHLLPENVNALEQIGIYGANYKISILMTLFIQTFRYAFEPFFFSQEKEKKSKKMYADVMSYFIIFGLFIFVGIMLYIDVVKYFVGAKYHEGIHIVPILLAANLFLGIIYNLSVWYKLTDKTKFGAIIAITGAFITLIFNYLLIPHWGYLGSAWATFICYFSMMLISYFWGRKYYKVPYQFKKIGLYFVLTAIIFVISQVIETNQLVKYLVNTILFLFFVSFVVWNEKLYLILHKIRYKKN